MDIENYFVSIISLLIIIAPITVYPDTDENNEDDKQYVDEKCDASEDYETNKKECDKLYDALEEDEKDDINSFEDGIKSTKIDDKDMCKEEYGNWVNGECDLDEDQY